MDIIVPTRGRVGRQRTLQFMSKRLRERTIMVGPAHEYRLHLGNDYMRGVRFLAQPDPNMTIAAKRAWILRLWGSARDGVLAERVLEGHEGGPQGYDELVKIAGERLVMLDDDLRFYIRRDDKPDRLRYAEAEDQEVWFEELESQLSTEVPHAGFGPRQGNNTQEAGWQSPGRMMYALGYHVPTVVRECELGRIETREDFDLALQLLSKGYPNRVCHTFVVGQAEYNEAGGASLERTLERSNADARKLAELHPGLVRVVAKEYKKDHSRDEVVCYWSRALKQGVQRRQDHPPGPQGG